MEKNKIKDVSASPKAAGTVVATIAPTTLQDAKKRPALTLRVEDCSASIWAREYMVQGTPRIFYSVSFERAYKARDGWKYTRSFGHENLGHLISLCQQANEKIGSLMQQEAAQ